MAINSYSTLKTTIEGWSHRADVAAYIDDFILMTESLFNQELRLSQMENRATTSASTEYLAFPSDALEITSIRLNGDPNKPLIYMTPYAADELDIDLDVTGEPQFYTVVGDEVRLIPPPDASYTVEIAYIANIPALNSTNTSNFILANWPQLYLHGCLYFCGIWSKDPDMASTNKQMFDAGIASVIRKNGKRKHGNPVLRTELSTLGVFDIQSGT